jgi:hypothetical protein
MLKKIWRNLLLTALLPLMVWFNTAHAQSACTALWGTIDDNGGAAGSVTSLRYFNTTTNRWINLSPTVTLNGNANALAGDPATGILYYVDRTTGNLRSYNLNTQVDANLGAIPLPAPITAVQILGATMPSAGNLILYWTENTGTLATDREYIGRINVSAPATATWTQILTAAGANQLLGNSGDMFTNNGGTTFIVSNTTPSTTFWVTDVNPTSPTYSRITLALRVHGAYL